MYSDVHCIYFETLYLVLLYIHVLILNLRVVCVGGDGMFSELLNGLCERKLKEAGLEQTPEQNPIPPDLKIGVIPAGNICISKSVHHIICYCITM